MKKYRFTSLEPETLKGFAPDIAISCIGYESRATHVASLMFLNAGRRVAVGFDRQQLHAFESNKSWFAANKTEMFLNVPDEAFAETVRSLLLTSTGGRLAQPFKIAVDVSCFDRYRLAVLCEILMEQVAAKSAEVTFIYNIAAYDAPEEAFVVNARLQPVHPSFVGVRPDPLAGTTAIIGLGYEREKALGAAEYLEANDVFTYCPSSHIAEYLPSVEKANELLLSQLEEDHRFVYQVEHPAKLVSDLSSLVRGVMGRSAVVMIPLGPKVFAVCCLLTALMFPEVSVWRMSQGAAGSPTNRRPSDQFSILRVST